MRQGVLRGFLLVASPVAALAQGAPDASLDPAQRESLHCAIVPVAVQMRCAYRVLRVCC